jgi:hyaluronoglucosaminidase
VDGSTNHWNSDAGQLALAHGFLALIVKVTKFLPSCLLLLAAAGYGATEFQIYPRPQKLSFGGGAGTISGSPSLVGADAADPEAMRLLKDCLHEIKGAGSIQTILVGERGDPAVASHLGDLPEKSGAYRIVSSASELVIVGHDDRGTYHAMRTLRQLLEADGNPATLPAVEITDWPDVAFRGAVEGFYGTPWSHGGRLSLIDFFGKHKLNTYIYGPKDDPFHSSPNWRKPYPPAEAARIGELVAACRRNKVDFVWAIHPGKDIQWNEPDFQAVLEKFEAMHVLGVRSYAVFFDDISGEGTKAEQQARLLNRLHAEFVVKKGDVTPLILCPTEYNKAWSNPKPGGYLEILGQTLEPSIHVMWTGNTVVADLDRSSMEWINGRIRRNAYIWWNFPVSDYVRNHLLMGPVYGNATDIKDLYGGFVSNPMERSEASKIALFGVADYAWNVRAYDSESAWKAAIREVMPGAADAFEVFCRHNSDLGPNGHGYRRMESVAFAPLATEFMAAFRVDKPADATAIRAELEKIRQAPAVIRAGSVNPALMAEIKPWLDAFEQLGQAGVAALDARQAMLAGKADFIWPLLVEANAALAGMAEINRTQNQNPYQPGVRTGSLVLTPMVSELVETTSARFLSVISGRPLFRPLGMTSSGERASLPLMLDGKEDTYFYSKEVQKVGDWFGIDLGGVHEIRRIRILQGRNDQDHDRVHRGVIEGLSGDSWEKIADVENARADVMLDLPKLYRSIRIRVLAAGSGTKPDVWTAIRQFDINPKDAAELRTDIPAFRQQPVRLAEQVVSISPMFETHSFPPGKTLGMLMPEARSAVRFEVDLKAAEAGESFVLEATGDGRRWNRLEKTVAGTVMTASLEGKIIAVRVRNAGRSTLAVTLAKFAITTVAAPELDPLAALADGRIETMVELKLDGSAKFHPPAGETPLAVTLLVSPKHQASAKLAAIVGGEIRPLGVIQSAYVRFPLPRGTTGVVISSDGNSSVLPLHELVWFSR